MFAKPGHNSYLIIVGFEIQRTCIENILVYCSLVRLFARSILTEERMPFFYQNLAQHYSKYQYIRHQVQEVRVLSGMSDMIMLYFSCCQVHSN